MTLLIKKTENMGRGVFTDQPYDTGSVLLKFPGKSMTAEQVSKLSKEKQGNVLQIGPDQYLNLEGETIFFANHHCNPNCLIHLLK